MDPEPVLLHGPPRGRSSKPGNDRVDRFPSEPITGSAAGLANLDLAVGADHHHGLVEGVEYGREPVPLGGERPERLAQGDPHRLERRPQLGDLVAPAGPLQRLVEPTLTDPRGAFPRAA